MKTILKYFLVSLIFLTTPMSFAQQSQNLQVVHSRVPGIVKKLALTATGRMDTTTVLSLAVCLPLRNQQMLSSLLHEIYNPASPEYHHYLTHDQFVTEFGPTQQDYQSVIAFAKANGFTVTGTHADRMLLDVNGSVSTIQRALHVNMLMYKHPVENREFYAPDVEPSINLSVPILAIKGLNNYVIPRPVDLSLNSYVNSGSLPAVGSGPNGSYMGNDFRAAYAPGVSLNGHGQKVGLFELSSGFYRSDIAEYETQAGLPNDSIEVVIPAGETDTWGSGGYNNEVSVDIETAISMAPDLDSVVVYEGYNEVDILDTMASDRSIKQFSASWEGLDGSTADQYFLEFQIQGQSFFAASGDEDSWAPGSYPPNDDPYITLAGGTALTTTGPGGEWSSETVWNEGYSIGRGTGGGISPTYSIPSYQQGINMSTSGGSTTMRNVPDVAMVATGVYLIYNNGDTTSGAAGTSIAAPLWAGFLALVNQQAVSLGDGTAGFINPAIYSIGEGNAYTTAFHDITTGTNKSFRYSSGYAAVSGYDVCTGWGTPKGQALINFLSNPVWSGTKILTSNYSIPSGQTLIIEPGTTVELASGVSITAGGVLNAVGTSSQPITFTSTGSTNPGSWGSIILSGAGANNSTLKYCNVEYGTDIEANNTSNVTIENCKITNNSSHAIDTYFSSNFLAQSDTIVNSNVYHGIYIVGGSNNNCYQNVIYKTNHNQQGGGILYSGSSGNVGGNDIDYYNWGIAGIWGASPNSFWWNAPERNNRVADCQYGLMVYENSYCDFGEYGPDIDGDNSIYGSTYYNADVGNWDPSVPSGLYAECDWWGTPYPPSSDYYVGSACYGYFNSPLSSDPWTGIPLPSNSGKVSGGSVRLAYAASRASDPNAQVQTSTTTPWQDSLLIGIGLREKNNFAAAKNFFMAFVKLHPDNPAGYVELYGCADDTTLPDIINFFKSPLVQAPKVRQLLLGYLYQMEGQPNLAEQVNDNIIAECPNTSLEVKAEMNNMLIDLYDKNDVQSAAALLANIQGQSNLTTPMELQDAETALSLHGGAAMAGSQKTTSSASTSNIPKSFGLSQNYPNPFNPTTTINFELKQNSAVKLDIFNVLGQRVQEFNLGQMNAGTYNQSVDMSRFASGVYFYRIDAMASDGERFVSMKKMVLIK